MQNVFEIEVKNSGTIRVLTDEEVFMSIKRMTIAALFMSMTLVLSSSFLSIPVPGGHLYFNGALIFLIGLLFRPLEAAFIAGVGSFLGDYFFYPAPMFVTLVVHGLQVFAIAWWLQKSPKPVSNTNIFIGLFLGLVIDLVGYSLGRAFVYSTPAAALVKLPFDIFQAALGVVLAFIIYRHPSFRKLWDKILK